MGGAHLATPGESGFVTAISVDVTQTYQACFSS
jgi:hypothetical protein